MRIDIIPAITHQVAQVLARDDDSAVEVGWGRAAACMRKREMVAAAD